VWQRQAVRHGKIFVKHVVPAVVKPIHSLWHQVIGFLFMVLAILCGSRGYHYYRAGEFLPLVVSGTCTAILLFYGLSSLLKARKISRS